MTNPSAQPFFKPGTPAAVALDFDGTITQTDVVDALIMKFTPRAEWEKLEAEWVAGRLSSDACMSRQLALVNVSDAELESFIREIRLDPGFLGLKDFLAERGVPIAVLSDGFDYFIEAIFKNHGVAGIPFRSNRLIRSAGRLACEFPYKKDSCGRCGHCKRATLLENRKNVAHLVFVGDGQSDLCAVSEADTVFAKGKLAEHCRRSGKPFYAYETLADVQKTLRGLLQSNPAMTAGKP